MEALDGGDRGRKKAAAGSSSFPVSRRKAAPLSLPMHPLLAVASTAGDATSLYREKKRAEAREEGERRRFSLPFAVSVEGMKTFACE